MTLGLQPRRVLVHRAADLVQDVLQLRRLRERALPRLVSGGMPRQVVGGHVVHRLIDGKRIHRSIPAVIIADVSACRAGAHPWRCRGPSPAAAGVSPLSSPEGSGAAAGFAVGLRFRLGAVLSVSAAAAAGLLGARAGAHPAAMPRPLTSGSGFAGASAAAARCLGLRCSRRLRRSVSGSGPWLGGAAAAFLAPGRLAPAAMPRPLTAGSALAGLRRSSAGAASAGAGFLGRCRGGLLRAGPLGAAGDAEALDRRRPASGGRLRAAVRRLRPVPTAAVFLAPGRLAPPAMPSPCAGLRLAVDGFLAAGSALGWRLRRSASTGASVCLGRRRRRFDLRGPFLGLLGGGRPSRAA